MIEFSRRYQREVQLIVKELVSHGVDPGNISSIEYLGGNPGKDFRVKFYPERESQCLCVEGDKVSEAPYGTYDYPPYRAEPLESFEDDEDPEPDTDYFERG